MMRLLIAIGLGVAAWTAVPQDDPSAADLKKFQGEWDLLSIISDGKEQEKNFKGADWKVKGDKLMYIGTKDDSYDEIKLDATKTPKTMTCVSHRPDMKPKEFKAIYKFDGDRIILCVDPENRGFPKTFESKEGSNLRLITIVKSKSK
jgi:uncharacterized protein (TIGR03067 family)